jgi:hypothetical protein
MRTDFSPALQMNPLMAIGAGLSLAGAVGKYFSGVKQVRESKKINPVWNQYRTSPFAQQQMSIAKNYYNDPSFGTRGQLTRDVFANNANFMGNVNRNATSSSQALALGAAGQGQTDEALSKANMGFMQNKASALQNLNQAYGTMIDEGDKEYQSLLTKYGMDSQRKDALRASGAQNKYGAISDLAGGALQASMIDWKNPFGKKTTKPQTEQPYNFVRPSGSVANRLNWMNFQKRNNYNPATGKFE